MTLSCRSARHALRGLYGIADAEASGGDPIRLATRMLEGGCRIIQLRCKGWPEDLFHHAAADVARRCRAADAVFIVNDDPWIARRVNADGVHVGQLDASTDEVRRVVGSDRWIGRSTNSLEQLHDAIVGVDYVAFGPIWSTPHLSHPKRVQGPTGLERARQLVPASLPLIAIGGIRHDRIMTVHAAGADAWAVIGAIARAEAPVDATRALIEISPLRTLHPTAIGTRSRRGDG